jgi:hypothetical protein
MLLICALERLTPSSRGWMLRAIAEPSCASNIVFAGDRTAALSHRRTHTDVEHGHGI